MVEIIPKESPKVSIWLVSLFYLSLVLSLIFTAGFFWLDGSIKKNQAALNELDNELSGLQSSENIALKREISNYDKKIKDFKILIENHKFNSRIFKFIENFIHPDVWLTSFEFQNEGNKIALSGKAKTFESLGQQIIIFQKEQQVRELILEGISIDNGGDIGFDISFSLDPKILQ